MLVQKRRGAVCQYYVVFGEAFLHGRGGGDNYHAAEAKPEGEDGAVFLSEAVEGAVDGGFDEVEVA